MTNRRLDIYITRLIISYFNVIISYKSSEANNIRRTCDIKSSTRRITSTTRHISQEVIYHGKCELDSHTDTIVAGKNCV